jgi:hypothetical protein
MPSPELPGVLDLPFRPVIASSGTFTYDGSIATGVRWH